MDTLGPLGIQFDTPALILSVPRVPYDPHNLFNQSKCLLYYTIPLLLNPAQFSQPKTKPFGIWVEPLHIGLGTERVKTKNYSAQSNGTVW